jgi:hypothetical protein
MMTAAWPTASRMSIDGVRSRSRQPLLLRRKAGLLMAAAEMTSSRTTRIENSPGRSRPSIIRRRGDRLLGSTRSCTSLKASGTVTFGPWSLRTS